MCCCDSRALIDVVFRPEPGSGIESVVIAPSAPSSFSAQDPRPARTEPRVLPLLERATVDVGSERERGVAWKADTEAVKVGQGG